MYIKKDLFGSFIENTKLESSNLYVCIMQTKSIAKGWYHVIFSCFPNSYILLTKFCEVITFFFLDRIELLIFQICFTVIGISANDLSFLTFQFNWAKIWRLGVDSNLLLLSRYLFWKLLHFNENPKIWTESPKTESNLALRLKKFCVISFPWGFAQFKK